MTFCGSNARPGAILNSGMTETAPTLCIQVFDKGEHLFSIAVMDRIALGIMVSR